MINIHIFSCRRIAAAGMVVTALLCAAFARADETDSAVKAAIVKIYTIHDVPDYYNPWSMKGPFGSTGSGCVIKGRKILTNAHVVSDKTFIQVRRYGDAKKYEARVLSVSHAADLALLTVNDPAFFEGVTPLDFGDLPRTREEILVYGFPLGGDTLSTTKGVVSRIEHQTYTHSSDSFLAVQIDAALNPGNSGGPAINDGKIVGVAMQVISQASNIGYIVPVPIINHFLHDLEDGRYNGFPSIGVVMQGMENPDMKRMYKMSGKQTGMLILKVLPSSPADKKLQAGDVLLSVEGHQVADDGTVEFRPKERTSASYYIQEHQVGESLDLEILRTGEVKKVSLTLDRSLDKDRIIPLDQYDVMPSYFIYGGVVFCPLTMNLLKEWGPNWRDQAPEEFVAALQNNYVTEDTDQVVLALKVLAADINQGYHETSNWVITEVNGKKVRDLKDLVHIVESSTNESFIVFKNKLGNQIVLDPKKVTESAKQILEIYRINSDRSGDLRDPAPAKM